MRKEASAVVSAPNLAWTAETEGAPKRASLPDRRQVLQHARAEIQALHVRAELHDLGDVLFFVCVGFHDEAPIYRNTYGSSA